MIRTSGDFSEALGALASSFDEEVPLPAGRLTMDDVHAFVAAHVARLLDDNRGLLMSILYRIDVAEARVRRVLESGPPDSIVDDLTELIIERQVQKMQLRRRFSQRASD